MKITDEQTKNHRTLELEKETERGFLPQYTSPDERKLCPVFCFETYVSHLHPDCPWLWAKPYSTWKRNSPYWYSKAKMGKSCFGSFMQEVSEKCGLSQKYTNHCCRATGNCCHSNWVVRNLYFLLW